MTILILEDGEEKEVNAYNYDDFDRNILGDDGPSVIAELFFDLVDQLGLKVMARGNRHGEIYMEVRKKEINEP